MEPSCLLRVKILDIALWQRPKGIDAVSVLPTQTGVKVLKKLPPRWATAQVLEEGRKLRTSHQCTMTTACVGQLTNSLILEHDVTAPIRRQILVRRIIKTALTMGRE